MVGGDTSPFNVIQNRRRAGLVDNIIFSILQISFLLLPEEVDAEVGHERRELVGDVL